MLYLDARIRDMAVKNGWIRAGVLECPLVLLKECCVAGAGRRLNTLMSMES